MIKVIDAFFSFVMVVPVTYYVYRLITKGSDIRWMRWLAAGFLVEAVLSAMDHDSVWIVVMLASSSILYSILSLLDPTPSLRQLWAQRND